MAFFTWKKLGKIASKAGRTIIKEAADKATGGLYSVAASRLKSIGQVHAARKQLANVGAIAPAPVRATIEKQTMHLPAQASLYDAAYRARTAKKASNRRAVTRSTAPTGGNGSKPKRSPPAGGKNLKALSASWRAAGKPGKWLDWVKSH